MKRKGFFLGRIYIPYRYNYLTLYAPCIILQYVYEPTGCTEFL